MKYKMKDGEIEWLGIKDQTTEKQHGITVSANYVDFVREKVKFKALDKEVIEGIVKHALYGNKIQESASAFNFWKI